jgi:hypothetical protein
MNRVDNIEDIIKEYVQDIFYYIDSSFSKEFISNMLEIKMRDAYLRGELDTYKKILAKQETEIQNLKTYLTN